MIATTTVKVQNDYSVMGNSFVESEKVQLLVS